MKKIILYSDDMIEEEEEEDEEMKDDNPPETKKPKMDMISKKFSWTEWEQKSEGDRVQGKSEL